jgi:hypothetical protein
VIERREEAPCGDGLLQIHVGGGDYADVDLAGVSRSQGLDDPVFDDSQEHRLDVERREADLIEEDGAASGGPKVAWVVGSRAGESALLARTAFVGRTRRWPFKQASPGTPSRGRSVTSRSR